MKPSSSIFLSVLPILFLLGVQSEANFNFTFTVTDANGGQGSQRDLHVLLDSEKDRVKGWSLGVCHDPNLLTINSVGHGPDLQAFNDGEGPDLFFYNVYPESPLGPGWNAGVVISALALEHLTQGIDYDIHVANYTLVGNPGKKGLNTLVCPCHKEIGSPPTPMIVIPCDNSFLAEGECGRVDILPPSLILFRRGDCNDDGLIDIADPVYNLAYLFQEGPSLCLDAQDTNDDGTVNIADPVYNINFQFTGGPAPPEPFPDCGGDVTPDELDCADPLLECP